MISPSEEKWPIFLYSYRYKGKEWGFELPAEGFEDAQSRLAAIHYNGKLDGKLEGAIPASVPAAGLWVRLIVFVRNLFEKS